MPSVLQFFHSNPVKNTNIQSLSIKNSNSLASAEERSLDFFSIANGRLDITNHFDVEDSSHTDFVNTCNKIFINKSEALHDIDQRIMAAVVVALVAGTLSFFLPFVACLVIPAWITALYFASERGLLYREYNQALNLMVATLNWSLGQEKHCDFVDLQKNDSVLTMINNLVPLLSEEQVHYFINQDIISLFLDELATMDEQKTNLNHEPLDDVVTNPAQKNALKKRYTEFHRCIYGYNRDGKVVDFIDAFLSAFPDLWQAAVNGGQACIAAFNRPAMGR